MLRGSLGAFARRITRVEAFSHQGFPITFELHDNGKESKEFAIDQQTGEVDLLRTLDYEKSEREYTLSVKAIENGRPTLTSTVGVSRGRDPQKHPKTNRLQTPFCGCSKTIEYDLRSLQNLQIAYFVQHMYWIYLISQVDISMQIVFHQ